MSSRLAKCVFLLSVLLIASILVTGILPPAPPHTFVAPRPGT